MQCQWIRLLIGKQDNQKKKRNETIKSTIALRRPRYIPSTEYVILKNNDNNKASKTVIGWMAKEVEHSMPRKYPDWRV